MRQYIIHYDTNEDINQTFMVEAESPASADDAFYYEVETEAEVTSKWIEEVAA